MANNTTYEQIQSLQLSNPFQVFSSNNDPHKQFIHALFGNPDGINVEIENNLKHIININTFSLTIDYFQKRFISNTTSKILSKYGIDKDKQIIGRAQRPGRTSILNIMRLCYENETASVSNNSTRLDHSSVV